MIVLAVFGYDAIGPNTNQGGAMPIGSRFQCPEDGVVTMIKWYGWSEAPENARCGIYSDVAGEPVALLAQSGEVVVGVGAAWYEFPLNCAVSGGVWYWLCVTYESGYGMRYDAGAASQFVYALDNYGFDDPFVAGEFYLDWKMSIYAVYTAGGGVSAVVGSGGRGRHHGGDKRYKDARVVNGWKLRS